METRERRAEHRYGLDLPIVFRRAPADKQADVVHGKTHNISTRGIYFKTDGHLAVDDTLDFVLTFPGLANGEDIVVTGCARVLRLAPNIFESISAAALIEKFQIVRPQGVV